MKRYPINLTDRELVALLFVSNVALDDDGLWDSESELERAEHSRVNDKLRREFVRRELHTRNPS